MFFTREAKYDKCQQLDMEEPAYQEGNGKSRDRRQEAFLIILFCVLQAVVLLLGFSLYENSRTKWASLNINHSSQGYDALSTYNTTRHFTENFEMMEASPEAERLWRVAMNNHGVVSVPTDWALDRGFSPSQPHPFKDGHSVYQVDVFHSLHCLYRLRQHILTNDGTEIWPFGEAPTPEVTLEHTLHCVNFIRQQLMCHADITLQGTDDFLHYAKNNGHQCRDYDALLGWVGEHNWVGHHEWLAQHYASEHHT